MTQASTCDGQLSPVCPWCGLAGCQVWCKEVAFGQSADSSATLHSRFPGLHIVCMKQASTFDVQLSPGCPWCGQVGNQAWCKEVAMEEQSDQELQEQEHTAEAPLQMCSQRILGVFGSFFGYGCPYSCFCLVCMRLSLCQTPVLDITPSTPQTLVNV